MKINSISKHSLHYMVIHLEKPIKMWKYKCEVQFTLLTNSGKNIGSKLILWINVHHLYPVWVVLVTPTFYPAPDQTCKEFS